MIQEVLEETGLQVSDEQTELAVLSERFFKHRSTGRKCHETCMFYRVTLPEGAVLPRFELDGAGYEFVWLKLNQLQCYALREHYMFHSIPDITQGFHHVFYREAECL